MLSAVKTHSILRIGIPRCTPYMAETYRTTYFSSIGTTIRTECSYMTRTMTENRYAVSTGIPQGSVLAPILWNIMYDGVLKLKLHKGTHIIWFADDIALVIRGKHFDELVMTCNTTVGAVRRWIAGMGLELADYKIEFITITEDL